MQILKNANFILCFHGKNSGFSQSDAGRGTGDGGRGTLDAGRGTLDAGRGTKVITWDYREI